MQKYDIFSLRFFVRLLLLYIYIYISLQAIYIKRAGSMNIDKLFRVFIQKSKYVLSIETHSSK